MLAAARHFVNALRDFIRRFIRGRNRDMDGVIEELLRQRFNFRREGGREEERLTFAGQDFHDFLQRMDKTHIQHLVSFIQNQNFNFIEPNGLAVQQVYEPSGRRDQNIIPARQPLNLPRNRYAAKDARD